MNFIKYILFITLFLFVLFSCHKPDQYITDSNATLIFSTDTILFDTIFTNIGSTTQSLIIYNKYNKILKVSRIFLSGSDESQFRLNIDGNGTNSVTNLEIPANDSIYIFVEVTINPNDDKLPFVVEDSIIFITNNNEQQVKLIAWGQNAIIINKNDSIIADVWTNEKPYLIYTSFLIDTLQTLTINSGTKIYFHRNTALFVLGTLIVNGTKDEPVIFQGDRLEDVYQNIPGQWGYIHFLPGSQNNVINYAIIKNAIIGIQIDSFITKPALILKNTIIKNMNYAGIFAQNTSIKAFNCVFANSGYYCVALTIGGDYEFYHCTFANYWSYFNRLTPALVLNNYYKDINDVYHARDLEKAYFGNCIIYGNQESEIVFDNCSSNPECSGSAQFNYTFDHCLIKLSTEINTTSSNYNNVIKNQDPLFISIEENNYEIDSLSPARDKGSLDIINLYPQYLINDLNGNSRTSDIAPDLGAYETNNN